MSSFMLSALYCGDDIDENESVSLEGVRLLAFFDARERE
jgi:hypothetical protein